MDIVLLLLPCCLLKTRSSSSLNYVKFVCFFSQPPARLLIQKNDLFFHACVYMLGVDTCTCNSREFAHAKLGHRKAGQLVVSCGKYVLQYLSLLFIL